MQRTLSFTSFLSRMGAALLAATLLAAVAAVPAAAQGAVNVYGPGGPLPAMKEAAAAFGQKHGVTVTVTAGPTPQWLDKAKADADVVFSGAENMMTDFIKAMEGRIVEETVEPLYLRPSVILVRPGNPKAITGIRDLLQPGRTVMVVHGAGQVALWEDIVGRTGDIAAVKAFRRNIVATAPNSAEATKLWSERPEIDAWIIWNIWNAADRTPTDVVPVEPELRIWRDTGVALTRQGAEKAAARDFVAFLKSPDGKAIFAKYGWVEKAG